MAAEDHDTSKTAVRTYVPAYQRDIWDDHADNLDMSRSEFVRTMVQAGRRGFDPGGQASETTLQNEAETETSGNGDQAAETAHAPVTGEGLESIVLAQLEDGCLTWDELFDAVTDDVGDRLESTLDDLQADNQVKYSGREGGYVLAE